MSEKRTLLLNNWYFPIKILRWQDAVKMKYEETIDVVSEYDDEISSPTITWKMPAVIRLRRSIKNHKQGAKFSRVNVYTRDNHYCQYCCNKFPHHKLSYDHVVPRCAGGRTNWTNIVTACKRCNSKKDNRTCDEAGMFPRTLPAQPRSLPLSVPVIRLEHAPIEWVPFLAPFMPELA